MIIWIKNDLFSVFFISTKREIEWSLCQVELKTAMKKKLMTKWLSNSGPKVKRSRNRDLFFYKNDANQMVLHLNGTEIKSSNTMNILGVIFDSKLQWCSQVAYSIKKANNALNAIKLIK